MQPTHKAARLISDVGHRTRVDYGTDNDFHCCYSPGHLGSGIKKGTTRRSAHQQ